MGQILGYILSLKFLSSAVSVLQKKMKPKIFMCLNLSFISNTMTFGRLKIVYQKTCIKVYLECLDAAFQLQN